MCESLIRFIISAVRWFLEANVESAVVRWSLQTQQPKLMFTRVWQSQLLFFFLAKRNLKRECVSMCTVGYKSTLCKCLLLPVPAFNFYRRCLLHISLELSFSSVIFIYIKVGQALSGMPFHITS